MKPKNMFFQQPLMSSSHHVTPRPAVMINGFICCVSVPLSSHSAPNRKEVPVQLLDSRTPQTSKPPQKVPQSNHGAPGEVGVQTEAWPPPERRGDVAAAAPPVKVTSRQTSRFSFSSVRFFVY